MTAASAHRTTGEVPGNDRVRAHTASGAREDIDRKTRDRVAAAAAAGPAGIERRLAEIEGESDIERLLEGVAAGMVLAGVGLTVAVDRRFVAIPGLVGLSFGQHALKGWCPPMALLRRLGGRTRQEIEHERYALKALRGDFAAVDGPDQALAAAGR